MSIARAAVCTGISTNKLKADLVLRIFACHLASCVSLLAPPSFCTCLLTCLLTYLLIYLLTYLLDIVIHNFQSRDNSVGIALGLGLDYRGSRVRFPAGGWEFLSSPPRP
jgi:hypothetical protein